MEFIFEQNTIRGRRYKEIFQYLCRISNIIYFTYYEYLMINERIFELSEQCEKIDVPRKIRNWFDANVIGYKINIFIQLYLYEYESISQLLGDREYGAVLFYENEDMIAYIRMTSFRDIELQTVDKKLIEMLSPIGYR